MPMTPIKLFTTAALVVACGAGTAAAADRGGARGAILFDRLDFDGDGAVTKAEIAEAGAMRFADADTDGDGYLTSAEIVAAAQARRTARAERMVERLDRDGDGRISLEEARAPRGPLERMFDRLDTDADGAVTKAELDAGRDRFGRRSDK